MYLPFIFLKKIIDLLVSWCHGVDVSDDVNTTKTIRRVNEKMF